MARKLHPHACGRRAKAGSEAARFINQSARRFLFPGRVKPL
jgi:hypothetical protein